MVLLLLSCAHHGRRTSSSPCWPTTPSWPSIALYRARTSHSSPLWSVCSLRNTQLQLRLGVGGVWFDGREGKDVADVRLISQQHDHAVQAHTPPNTWRQSCAVWNMSQLDIEQCKWKPTNSILNNVILCGSVQLNIPYSSALQYWRSGAGMSSSTALCCTRGQ